jgi:hypothetical protein
MFVDEITIAIIYIVHYKFSFFSSFGIYVIKFKILASLHVHMHISCLERGGMQCTPCNQKLMYFIIHVIPSFIIEW